MKYWIFQYKISILIIFIPIIMSKSAAKTDLTLENVINQKHLKLIEDSMDLTAKPCDDFYQYACGNWEKVHNKTLGHYDQNYDVIEHLYNKEIENIFSKSSNLKGKPKFVQNAYAYYKSCVNMQHYDLLKYLRYFLHKEQLEMSSWPLKSVGQQKHLNWIRNLAAMHKYGLRNIFVREYITSTKDMKRIQITKPLKEGGGFEKLTYKILDTMNSWSFKFSDNTLKVLWQGLSKFETKLQDIQNLHIDPERKETFTIKNLDALPVWLRQFVKLLLQQMHLLEPQVKIVIKDIPYMHNIVRLLKEYDEPFLCKYLEIRFIYHLYRGDFQVPYEFTPEMCIVKTRQYMNLALEWLYVTQKPEVLKQIPQIEKMFNRITKQYRKILLANKNGFDAKIIKHLVNKLDDLKLKIGLLPHQNTAVKQLKSIYKMLHLNESNVLDNQFQLLEFSANYKRTYQAMPNDPKDFYDLEKPYSPYYRRELNTVTIPLTALRLPIYHAKLQDTYKYSSLGYIMGHEISHAFDLHSFQNELYDIGLDHSAVITSNPKFHSNLNCLQNLNDLAIDEKISDVTGFRVAYQTYMILHPNSRNSSLIVNKKKFTLNKLFFLNFANFKCSSYNLNSVDIDHSHGTPHDRLIDTFAHFPEFAKTFHCSKSDHMNLKKKCQLWRK